MSTPLHLTILMPCLNEAETIAQCIEKAKTGLARAGVPGKSSLPTTAAPTGPRPLPKNWAPGWWR